MARTWAETVPANSFRLSAIPARELEFSVLRVERRDAVQGALLRQWLENWVLVRFGERILGVDIEIVRRAAQLHVPDPRPERDALIAATALTHGLTVATRNISDFEPMGVALINPWLAPGA